MRIKGFSYRVGGSLHQHPVSHPFRLIRSQSIDSGSEPVRERRKSLRRVNANRRLANLFLAAGADVRHPRKDIEFLIRIDQGIVGNIHSQAVDTYLCWILDSDGAGARGLGQHSVAIDLYGGNLGSNRTGSCGYQSINSLNGKNQTVSSIREQVQATAPCQNRGRRHLKVHLAFGKVKLGFATIRCQTKGAAALVPKMDCYVPRRILSARHRVLAGVKLDHPQLRRRLHRQ